MMVLEATGGLEIPITGILAAAGIPVIVVNPRQVRGCAKATGRLAKTDALEAQTLAHFAEVLRPTLPPLPDENKSIVMPDPISFPKPATECRCQL